MKSYRSQLTVNRDKTLASLYPTTKFALAAVMSALIAIVASATIWGYSLMLIPLFLIGIPLLFMSSGIIDKFVSSYRVVVMLSLVIFLAQTFLIHNGPILAKWGPLTITAGGLQRGISLTFVLLNLCGIIFWLINTITPNELSYALDHAGLGRRLTYMLVSSTQMIDSLSMNSKAIMKAQEARGVETQGSLLVRARAMVPMLVPLVVSSITQAQDRVLTLEIKGFSYKGPKTHFLKVDSSGKERRTLIIAVVLVLLVLIGRILLWSL